MKLVNKYNAQLLVQRYILESFRILCLSRLEKIKYLEKGGTIKKKNLFAQFTIPINNSLPPPLLKRIHIVIMVGFICYHFGGTFTNKYVEFSDPGFI